MPDHLHLLLTPMASPLTKWVAAFKSFTTRASWRFGMKGPLWQPSFHDRALRGAREFDDVVEYIATNPLNAGLAVEADEWPWLRLPAE